MRGGRGDQVEPKEPTAINTTELRLKTRDLMERVKFNGERFIVGTFGRPMAVILSVDEYRAMLLECQQIREITGQRPRSQTKPKQIKDNTKSKKRIVSR
jgi:PHD/YefM family antitoxin component YafN of YafNO toxin-antitoxin module